MRIAYLLDSFPSLSETFILNQITGLLDLGHEVDLFPQVVNIAGEQHPTVAAYGLMERVVALAPPNGKGQRALGLPTLLLRGLSRNPVTTLRALDPRRHGRRALSLRVLYGTVPFLGSKRRYDVVHAHYGINGLRGVALKQDGAIEAPLVVTFHGYDLRAAETGGPEWLLPLRSGADRVIAISEWSRERLERLGMDPSRIVIHPIGIDLLEFPWEERASGLPKEESAPVRLLTVARLAPEKGLDLGLRALVEVAANLPPGKVHWEIVGSGPEKEELTRLISTLGLEDCVTMTGGLSQPEVRRRFAQADLFFLPSRAEVTPTVLLEAQAMGLPVVATGVGAVSEVVLNGSSGTVVPPNDVAALADALKALIGAPERWPGMGKAGRRFVEGKHDIRRLNKQLETIFQDVQV